MEVHSNVDFTLHDNVNNCIPINKGTKHLQFSMNKNTILAIISFNYCHLFPFSEWTASKSKSSVCLTATVPICLLQEKPVMRLKITDLVAVI